MVTALLLLGITLVACMRSKDIFTKNPLVNSKHLKINAAIDFELKNKSEDVTPTHPISIGDDIYPNKNNYKLETPRIFKKTDTPNFRIETDYYYVEADDSVKVILYQWDGLRNGDDDATKRMRFYLFENKFNQLADSLTKMLGRPIEKKIEQNQVSFDETFRDDIRWKGITGINAYLFMFKNNETGYRQIRLALYNN